MSAISAVAYYRMSTMEQEHSIERQRSQVVPFAAVNGYTIIREYLDEGIAGDEEDKRKGFMRLMQDAQQKQFKIILCDDKDRFGRFDSITSGYYIHPLRKAGIKLHTVAQGVLDWSSFGGRITDAVLQEAKKLESQATSRRVMTRMLMDAKAGKWQGGVAPFGYKAIADEALGKRLIPGDVREVRAVQLMFRLVAEKGFTLGQVGVELTARGIVPPVGPRQQRAIKDGRRGEPIWQNTTIRAMLKNRKYVGDMTWNVNHDGKYSKLANGTVVTSDQRLSCFHNAESDWIILPNAHEAIVTRELFEAVQLRLADNKARAPSFPRSAEYLLRGLLVCGSCGWRMVGTSQQGRRYYKCALYHQSGNLGCGANMMTEDKLVGAIVGKLQEALLNPQNLAKLREEIRRQEAEEAATSPTRTEELRRQLVDLDSKVSRGVEKLALIDADLVPDVGAKVREWKEERDRCRKELAAIEKPAAKMNLDTVVKEIESQLFLLREAIQEGEPFLVRQLFVELIDHVELHFEKRPTGGKIRNIFQRGIVYVRPQQEFDLSALSSTEANPIAHSARLIPVTFLPADLAKAG